MNFNRLIIDSPNITKPTIIGQFKQKPMSCWNDECKRTHKEGNSLRRYKRTKSIADNVALNRASARARRTKQD